jgi:hypothetical protein
LCFHRAEAPSVKENAPPAALTGSLKRATIISAAGGLSFADSRPRATLVLKGQAQMSNCQRAAWCVGGWLCFYDAEHERFVRQNIAGKSAAIRHQAKAIEQLHDD